MNKQYRSKKYRLGVVRELKGVWYTVIDRDRKTTKLKAVKENLTEALRLLDARVEARLSGVNNIKAPRQLKADTVFSAIAAFKDSKSKSLTDTSRRLYRNAFTTFFDADMPLDYNLLHNRIAAVVGASSLKPSTLHKRFQYLNSFLKYCVEVGYLDKNPCFAIGLPRIKEPTVVTFSPREYSLILDYCYYDNRYCHYYRLYALLLYTGMRIGEALNLTVNSFDGQAIYILGKGDRPRYFPVYDGNTAVFKELVPVIDSLFTNNPDNYVFPWRNQHHPRTMLNNIMDNCGIPKYVNGASRSLHTFRKTAEWRWEHLYGLSERVICDLSGHSIAVRQKNYRKTPSAADIAAAIKLTA